MMGKRTTLILACAVMAAYGFLELSGRWIASTDQRATSRQKVWSIHADEVKAIAIESREKAINVEIGRVQGGWQLEKPYVMPLQRERVFTFLRQLQGLKQTTEIIAEKGISTPFNEPIRARVTLRDSGGEHVLEIGQPSAMSNGCYVRTPEDGRVAFVSRDVLELFPGSIDEWWNLDVWPEDLPNLVRVEAEAGGDRCELVLDGGEWRMLSPWQGRVDRQALDRWLNGLDSMKFEGMAMRDYSTPALYGLDEPAASLALHIRRPGAETRIVLNTGWTSENRTSVVYATLNSGAHVFELSKQARDSLMPSIEELRDRRPISLEPDRIQFVSIKNRYDEFSLYSTNVTDWVLGTTPPVAADTGAVSRLIRSWTSSAILDFVSTNASDSLAGQESSRQVVQVRFSTHAEAATNAAEGNVYAFRVEKDPVSGHVEAHREGEVYVLPPEWADDLLRPPLHWRSRRLWGDRDLSMIRLVSLETSASTNEWIPPVSERPLAHGESQATRADPSDTEDRTWLQTLKQSEVSEWIGDGLESALRFGLDKPDHVIRIEATRPIVYGFVGGHSTGMVYGIIRGEDAVFAMRQSDWKRLMKIPSGDRSAAKSEHESAKP